MKHKSKSNDSNDNSVVVCVELAVVCVEGKKLKGNTAPEGEKTYKIVQIIRFLPVASLCPFLLFSKSFDLVCESKQIFVLERTRFWLRWCADKIRQYVLRTRLYNRLFLEWFALKDNYNRVMYKREAGWLLQATDNTLFWQGKKRR